MPDLRYKWKRSYPLYSLVSRILLSLVSRDIFFDTRCVKKTQMRRHCHLKGMVIKVKHLSVVSSFDIFSQRKSRCILLLLFYVCLHLSSFILTLLFLSIPCSSFCFDDCQWYTWGFVWRCESGHELHLPSHTLRNRSLFLSHALFLCSFSRDWLKVNLMTVMKEVISWITSHMIIRPLTTCSLYLLSLTSVKFPWSFWVEYALVLLLHHEIRSYCRLISYKGNALTIVLNSQTVISVWLAFQFWCMALFFPTSG